MRKVSTLILCFFLLLSLKNNLSFSADREPFSPIKNSAELRGPYHRSQFALAVSHPVKTAKVLIADYELIQHDFPITRTMSSDEIDQWLIKEAGFVSKDQIEVGELRKVNSEIKTNLMKFKGSIRPPNYGRALVVEVEGGLIDLKGAGGLEQAISNTSHRNGLMETAEAIREYAYTKLMKKTLDHMGSEYRVIDSYAVMDYGFDVKNIAEQQMKPAGLFLRQAHFREINAHEQLNRKSVRKLERSFREFGITSAYKQASTPMNPEKKYDIINLQGSEKDKFIFDFGGYRVQDHFDRPGIALEDWNHYKYETIINEKDSKLIQPKKQYQELFENWGVHGDSEKIWEQSRKIADDFRTDGDLSKAKNQIQELLSPIKTIPNHVRVANSIDCLKNILKSIQY